MVERDDGFQRLGGEPDSGGLARRARETERLAAERPPLRPRGVGELLDVGIDVLRERFLPCVGICILLWLLPAWLMAYAPPESWAPESAADDPALLGLWAIAGSLFNTGISTLVQAFAAMVVAVIVRGEFAGEPVPLGAALGTVLRRAVPIVATVVLTTAISMGGFAACILPYFFFLWRLSLAPLTCACEDRGPLESIGRSFGLTRGTFLRWLGIAVVGGLLVAPLSMSTGLAAVPELKSTALDGTALNEGAYDLVLWLGGAVLLGVATAVAAAFTAAFYFDCRVRHEALDLREELAALAPARAVS